MGKKVGAEYVQSGSCNFRTWSPTAKNVQLVLKGKDEPVNLQKDSEGYWEATVENIAPGDLYKFKLNDQDEFPDPASRSQPQGVHAWSQVTDLKSFDWQEKNWKGRRLKDMIIYELHVGTFTPQGTFEAIIEKLDHLEELGINTIEIMPIAQFPGNRNWGYDGVYPFAAQDSYGGFKGLQNLINACHQRGFAVLLDVVYNHLGPEGNYLSVFGPYFTKKYHTPWGSALNYDDEYSDAVRNHFIQNALMWLEEYHFDGLRLDAIHEIIDRGAKHFLKELSEKVDELEKNTGRQYVLIAESDLNDTRIINEYEYGGYGLEGQWVDDFHHAVHTILTGEDAGYYKDYGKLEILAKSFRQAFVYDGVYSEFRKKTVGNSPAGLEPSNFVICIQNHDQVGNRLLGERLSQLISFEKQKLAAGIMLAAPYVPMLFMGEEFAEKNPFQYFVSHGDKDLVKAVQEGRKREFKYFNQADGEFPDPQSEDTFEHSKINWDFKQDPQQKDIFGFYKEMLKLRKEGAFKDFSTSEIKTKIKEESKILQVSAEGGKDSLFGIFNFNSEAFSMKLSDGKEPQLIVFSADKKFGGTSAAEDLRDGDTLNVPKESFLIFRM